MLTPQKILFQTLSFLGRTCTKYVTNLGTSSGLVAFGEIREVDGRQMMNIGATLDERIADGFYFCRALKAIEYLFAHPELMMEPASKKFEIPDNVQKKTKESKKKGK